MRNNNNNEGNVRSTAKKAVRAMKKLWSLWERKFKDPVDALRRRGKKYDAVWRGNVRWEMQENIENYS